MRRRIASAVALLVVGAVFVACTNDSRNPVLPTNQTRPGARRADITPGTCTNIGNLQSLINTAFGAGSPNANSALGKLDNLDKQLKKGNLAEAQAQANNIVSFIQQKAAQGLPGTTAQINALIGAVLCYDGLSPDTFLIMPTDAPQVLLGNGGQNGVSLQGNTVNEPTLITITELDENTPPLDTPLDQYPGFILLTQSSPLTKPAVVGVCAFAPVDRLPHLRLGHQAAPGAANFEVTDSAGAEFLNCPAAPPQASSRLPGWLQKLASIVSPRPLYAKQEFEAFRGVAGTATEFSPFGPVDMELEARGGVSGTATELLRQRIDSMKLAPTTATPTPGNPANTAPLSSRTPRTPGARVNTLGVDNKCLVADAPPGGDVEPECRPGVKLQTHNGRILANVPVSWAIGTGGGTIAPEASGTRACGTDYLATAATTTDAAGKVGVCWKLGGTPGANTVVATPSAGDLPDDVVFNPPTLTFTATALLITPTAGAIDVSFPYDGLPHAVSGASATCSHGLTPALTYSSGSAPINADHYTFTVTCGAGNPLYVTVHATASLDITKAVTTTTVSCPASVPFTNSAQTPCSASVAGPGLSQSGLTVSYTANVNVGPVTASASYAGGGNYQASDGSAVFQIGGAATTATVNCPVSVFYTGSAQTPCTGLVTGPGLSQAVTPTYTSNIVGTATATVNYAAAGNYLGSTASKTFKILYKQSGCFSSPVPPDMPPTKSDVNKGSNVPIKCTLLTASNAGVSNATGNLLVQDIGTRTTPSTPVTVFTLNNAFQASSSGNYAYGLNTSIPPNGGGSWVVGHCYKVTASWNDTSTSTGIFCLK